MVTQNARTYFAQCGNSIVQPKDEDAFTAEVLYMYFNRGFDDAVFELFDRNEVLNELQFFF